MNNKNEILNFKNKYLKYRFFIYPNLDEKELVSFLNKIEPFDRPDGYALIGNEVMIFEHFEFDASKHTKKGSSYREKKYMVDKTTNKLLNNATYIQFGENEQSFYEYRSITSEINFEANYKFYINNLMKIFKSHCLKIKSYEQNIIHYLKINNLVFKKCFFIEDKTLGISKGIDQINLVMPYIIYVWKKYPDINYICFGIDDAQKSCFILSNEILTNSIDQTIVDAKIHFSNNIQSINTRIRINKK